MHAVVALIWPISLFGREICADGIIPGGNIVVTVDEVKYPGGGGGYLEL